MHWLSLTIAIFLNAAAHLVLKWGRLKAASVSPLFTIGPFRLDLFLLLGGVIFFCSLLFYYFALSRIQVSIAYPLLMSGGLLLITTIPVLFLGERLAALQIFGILLVAAGMWFIVRTL